ncbi:MAG: nuclear transport factor 2 family protein [Polyangiaceae bacterium]|nr:nuclear transport factor 2 family protein [Polyangiaceae bacterium]
MDAMKVVEGWLDAIEAMDVQRIIDGLADDVELHVESMPRPITGKQLLRELLSSNMGAYERIVLERKMVVASGKDVAVLLHARVKLAKDTNVLGETLPTAGKSVEGTGALFATVNEAGKIARIMRVRDNLEAARQLGISLERMQSLLGKMEQRLAA